MPRTPKLKTECVIWATHQAYGFHSWPEATGYRAYLAFKHRHLFGFTVHVGVATTRREVEFHNLQEAIRNWCHPDEHDWNNASCESIAMELAEVMSSLGYDVRLVTVDEDGQCGATVTCTREA